MGAGLGQESREERGPETWRMEEKDGLKRHLGGGMAEGGGAQGGRADGSSNLTPPWSPEPITQPTEAEPMEPDPTLSLSGGSAIGLLVAGILGAGTLIGSVCFTIIQSLRYLHPSPLSTGQHPLNPHETQSWLNKETEMKPTPPSGRVIGTPEERI